MSAVELKIRGEVEALNLTPDSIIVATIDANIGPNEADRVREALRDEFGGRRVIVLIGVKLAVARAGSA